MHNEIKLTKPWLVAVWPGMGNVAVSAGYYLMAKLGMNLLAELPAQEYFDVEHVEIKGGIILSSRLPRSRVFAGHDPRGQHDLVVFIGEAQPPMGKYAFCRRLIAFARELGIGGRVALDGGEGVVGLNVVGENLGRDATAGRFAHAFLRGRNIGMGCICLGYKIITMGFLAQAVCIERALQGHAAAGGGGPMAAHPAVIVLHGRVPRSGRCVSVAQGGVMRASGHGVRSLAGVDQARGRGMPRQGRAWSMHALVMRGR